MLEKFWYDWEAADDDPGGELGISPHAHGDHVIAYVRRLDDLPGIVRP